MIFSMDIGGAERAALSLARHLTGNGDKVQFYFLHRGGKSFICEYEYYYLNYT